jgi:SAM-dependent methyltransferase
VTAQRDFDELVAEGAAEPVEGWDFSWLAGRATEERPPWGYAGLIAGRMSRARAALDIQTGGGEVLAGALAGIPRPPRVLAATESWPPNAALARERLAPLGGIVREAGDADPLPFPDATFDLVVSRHPVQISWPEVARVLAPGGACLSQQVGAGSNRELTDFMMGPRPVSQDRSPDLARARARAAGLTVTRLDSCALRVRFLDVGAVVYFLRKVLWTVPGFTVAGYRDRLAAMHAVIGRDGAFTCYSRRFLIEARKPGPGA